MVQCGILSFKHKMVVFMQNGKITINPLITEKINNLPQSVVWLSDLTQDELWRTGLTSKMLIKHNKYLNTPFENIYHNIDYADTSTTLSKMYFLLINLFKICQQHEFAIEEPTLAKSIKLRQPLSSNEVLHEAKSDTVKCITEHQRIEYVKNNYIVETIKENGLIYLHNHIQKIEIPNIQTSEKVVFKKIKNNLDEYQDKLFLCKCTSITPKNQYQYIQLPYNKSFKVKNRLYEKEWFTSHEYDFMKAFFHFEISEILLFQHSYKFNKKIIPQYKNIDFFSIVKTIYYENLWLSLMEGNDIESVFLSAYEKKKLFLLSILLIEKGYVVYEYGNNNITVLRHPKQNKDDLIKIVNGYRFHIF